MRRQSEAATALWFPPEGARTHRSGSGALLLLQIVKIILFRHEIVQGIRERFEPLFAGSKRDRFAEMELGLSGERFPEFFQDRFAKSVLGGDDCDDMNHGH